MQGIPTVLSYNSNEYEEVESWGFTALKEFEEYIAKGHTIIRNYPVKLSELLKWKINLLCVMKKLLLIISVI
jgi:hypothetical protein